MRSTAQARRRALSAACDAQRALPGARRLEHRPAHARGPRTLSPVELEAWLLFGRGQGDSARGSRSPPSDTPAHGHYGQPDRAKVVASWSISMRLILASLLVSAAVQAATAQYDFSRGRRLDFQKCSQEAGAQTMKFDNCMARRARLGARLDASVRPIVETWFTCMKSSYASQMGQHGDHARASSVLMHGGGEQHGRGRPYIGRIGPFRRA